MALAKSVVHLGQDGDALASRIVTVPETHRLEAVAEDSGKRIEPDRTVGDEPCVAALCGISVSDPASVPVVPAPLLRDGAFLRLLGMGFAGSTLRAVSPTSRRGLRT